MQLITDIVVAVEIVVVVIIIRNKEGNVEKEKERVNKDIGKKKEDIRKRKIVFIN